VPTPVPVVVIVMVVAGVLVVGRLASGARTP
jgi:hypothetical protein